MLSLPKASKAILALGLLSLASVAQAAIIEINADHFSVTYDDAQVGPYKQGLLSGSQDTVYFQPNTLSALSSGSQAGTPAPLLLTLTIDPGYTFAGLSFTERGDYFLLGGGAVNATASVQLLNPATLDAAVLNLAPGSPFAQTLASTAWELTGSFSPLGLGAPQTLLISLDNALFASAATGGLGFIQKTYAGFQVMTQPAAVPEPSSWALILIGLMAAMFAGMGRRRSVPVCDLR
ncbi:MAG: PEP-CTERM sorting domain-containing protein [Gammaproteobacteria bacterium]|nr:PEP-CTERM sorting domain-containing protein [Gammaproteobacteria bacterium]